MKQKRENEKKKKIENQEKVLRDKVEAWGKSVQIEEKIEKNKVEKILLSEQPSNLLLCKGTLACTATLCEVCELPPQVKRLLREFGDVFL